MIFKALLHYPAGADVLRAAMRLADETKFEIPCRGRLMKITGTINAGPVEKYFTTDKIRELNEARVQIIMKSLAQPQAQ